MFTPSLQTELDTFKAANSLLKNPASASPGNAFEEVLDNRIKETNKKFKDKASDIVVEDSRDGKKKKIKENSNNDLPNIMSLLQNIQRKDSQETKNTYALLEKFKETKKFREEEEDSKGARQQVYNNNPNVAGQATFQPVNDQSQRKMSKSQFLANWERLAPLITEDITKRAVRIDIPMLNDVQALVLRMHPDRSITISLLGSEAMGELVKQHKEQLNRNLRHHNLSLKEFNTYRSELEFNNESGTKKKKRQATKADKLSKDLF